MSDASLKRAVRIKILPPCALIFFAGIPNYLKLNGLEQHENLFLWFCRSEV